MVFDPMKKSCHSSRGPRDTYSTTALAGEMVKYCLLVGFPAFCGSNELPGSPLLPFSQSLHHPSLRAAPAPEFPMLSLLRPPRTLTLHAPHVLLPLLSLFLTYEDIISALGGVTILIVVNIHTVGFFGCNFVGSLETCWIRVTVSIASMPICRISGGP